MNEAHFTLDNTNGLTKDELDFHNEAFDKYFARQEWNIKEEDSNQFYNRCADKYFSEYMNK